MAEDMVAQVESKRLKILEADEIETVYGLPVFDDEDRAFYFTLTPPEKATLSQLHGMKSSVCYILQVGYFKARRQFFLFNLQQVMADAQYVQRRYFPDYDLDDLDITKVTRLKQQGLILELLQYRVCGEKERQQMRVQAQQVAQISSRPIYVFRELMAYLTRRHLVTPGYTVMQEMIGDVLQREKERLIIILLCNNLESGDVFCRHSVRFRSFEDDLLSDEQWQEKEALIAQVGLPILTQTAEEHLAELKELLETRLVQVNQRIASGENEQIEIKGSGRWHLPYSRVDEDVNNPFFESLPHVNIQAVFQFVNRHCLFMNEFTHVLHRYAGRQADIRTLIACILAWGTNMGLGRMGQTSDIGYQALFTTSNNFVRLETLQKANDVVANALAQLPIFQQYHIGNTIHSSSDGQKFETLIHTINARYSPKYFGLMKGIVAYTLVANHIPVSARIIGANEHESHYVFDLLYNNMTDIQPTVHSTDTHGTNEVNFGILNFFGYQFAPRYRDLYDKVAQGLYGFKHPSQYPSDWLLRPIRKINEKRVVDDWGNMKRIIVSLALKTTTQSIIIGKLSAYARKNKTKRALWEYDNIIRSLYLLDYIDSISLQRHVQKALNRGESYHKLHKAVSFANFGKLRFKTEGEQQIWNECGRLIANCIIFYNAMILSNVLLHQVKKGDAVAAAALEQVSPVAWQHINFYGRYEFTKSVQPIDIEAIVQELVKESGASYSTK